MQCKNILMNYVSQESIRTKNQKPRRLKHLLSAKRQWSDHSTYLGSLENRKKCNFSYLPANFFNMYIFLKKNFILDSLICGKHTGITTFQNLVFFFVSLYVLVFFQQ